MSNSANDATRRLWAVIPKLPPAPQLRCKACLLPYPQVMASGLCSPCNRAQERIQDAAAAAAEFIRRHGQAAWDAQLAEKIKELF
jgi:hypothetical protein